jgi:hypothetical protein
MRIRKLTNESCEILRRDVKSNFDAVKNSYYNHPIRDFESLTRHLPKIDSGGSILLDTLFDSEIQMKLETRNGTADDFVNSKIIYEAFSYLTPLEANDARLWIRLTHDHCHKYVVKRWSTDGKSSDVIIDRFFYEGSSQHARLSNGVARLWWIAHLTVDREAIEEDQKWRFTKAVCKNQDFITSIFDRTMGAYENVRFGILEYYLENPEAFKGNMGKKIQQLTRDLNNYGGVTLLPLMTKDEVKEVCARLLPVETEQEPEEENA